MKIEKAQDIKAGDKIKAANGQEGVVASVKGSFIKLETGDEISDLQLQMFIDKGIMVITRA